MYRYGTLAFALALIPGCFLWCPLDGPFGDLTGSPELKRFESEQELADYLTGQIRARNDRFSIDNVLGFPSMTNEALDGLAEDGSLATGDEGPDSGPATPQGGSEGGTGGDADASSEPFSETTIQEVGVDEADVVKTDGNYLYVIHENILRIVQVTPRDQLTVLSEVTLEGYGREMYLHDGTVVALTETYGGIIPFGGGGFIEPGFVGIGVAQSESVSSDDDADQGTSDDDSDMVADFAPPPSDVGYTFERPRTIVTILDVSTPEAPVRISQTMFDGSQSSSRMIDGVLHLVVSNFQDYYYDVLPMLGREELDLTGVDTGDLLPQYERIDADGNTTTGPVITWQELYRPTDPDGFGVMTVVSLDTADKNAQFSAVGIVAEPGLIYSSRQALYLTDTDWDFFGNTRETTDIYKFAYVGTGTTAVATGTVPGRVLNQYSMGEHQGYLRIATTGSGAFAIGDMLPAPANNVYVLEEVDGTLKVAGRIENIARGETIQSARFVGNKGYLVTFLRIDPLFTLDLSDPGNPRVVGERKVPGFSTFIVPMDEGHLLTLGRYIPEGGSAWSGGVQLSIFDVSNFANPTLKHIVVIGEDGGASSEALNNPKAFTYFAEAGLVALPIDIHDSGPFIDDLVLFEDEDGEVVVAAPAPQAVPDEPPPPDEPDDTTQPFVPEEFRGLLVYRVSTETGFEALGGISTRFESEAYRWPAFTRAVFIGDDVLAVTDRGMRGAPVDAVETVAYELQFETAPPLPPEPGEPDTKPDAVTDPGSSPP